MIKKILLLIFISLTKLSISQCSVQISVNSVDCISNGNNSVSANPIGQYPILYSWSNGDTTSIADSLNYNDVITITITDDTGCVATVTEITPSPPSYANLTVTNASCFNCCDGSVSFTPVNNSQLCNIISYDWFPNNVNTTTPDLSGVCAGNYTVVINTDCFCSGAFTFNVPVNNIGINENSNVETNILLFPNPANSLINIELPYSSAYFDNNKSLIVYNALGQIALKQNINEQSFNLNVSEFEKGIYLVTIVDHNIVQFSKKFIKE